MGREFLQGVLKRFILWDFARATWQYDVMVGLILAFIFLTPRGFFQDQPRPKKVMMLSTGEHGSSFLVDADMLAGVRESDRRRMVEQLIHKQAGGRNRAIVSLEPVFDKDEKEPLGYMIHTRP